MQLRFHSEHIGSLIRPNYLLQARKEHPEGSRELKDAEEKAINQLVANELKHNVTPITDGEFRRVIFYEGFFDKIPGFSAAPNTPISDFRVSLVRQIFESAGLKTWSTMVCDSKLDTTVTPLLPEWESLKSLVPAPQWPSCKITLPSPTYFHLQLPHHIAVSPAAYPDSTSFFAALSAIYRGTLSALHASGLRNVQVDDPGLCFFLDPSFHADLRSRGTDPATLLDEYIAVHNACLRDRPADLHAGVHLCRGNWGTTRFVAHDSSYEAIAEKLFRGLDYDTFYLEFDIALSAADDVFAPLRFLPRGKNVVLGLISTKTSAMEDVDVLTSKIREAAKVIAKGQEEGVTVEEVIGHLGISPQCGFSSASDRAGDGVDEEVMWRKLGLVKEVAERVWGKEG
ncbi:MAG: hypothetical protein Q9160_002578 [Pyrenula sp. 1 TL-2023]